MPRKLKDVSRSAIDGVIALLPARRKVMGRLAIYVVQQGIDYISNKHRNNLGEITTASDETIMIEYDENGKVKKETIVRSIKGKVKIATISVVGSVAIYYIYK